MAKSHNSSTLDILYRWEDTMITVDLSIFILFLSVNLHSQSITNPILTTKTTRHLVLSKQKNTKILDIPHPSSPSPIPTRSAGAGWAVAQRRHAALGASGDAALGAAAAHGQRLCGGQRRGSGSQVEGGSAMGQAVFPTVRMENAGNISQVCWATHYR